MKTLVITPVSHIDGVTETLEGFSEVSYLTDPTKEEVISEVGDFDALFTNPNKSKVFLGEEIFSAGKKLKVVCTASTGTNHIDLRAAEIKGVDVISITEERHVIDKISSTAELAFALTLSSLRHVTNSHKGALLGEWDYTNYIGRQMNFLTVGVVGYGRLGKLYASYANAMGSRVVAYDPYKNITNEDVEQLNSLENLLTMADVVSLHVHVTPETVKLIGEDELSLMKSDALLVNTSRGDVIDEKALLSFLENNQNAKVAVDVLASEIHGVSDNALIKYAKSSGQVLITQHIGGMTKEAQELAYGHAAKLLRSYFA